MTWNTVAKQYDRLTPEERFRLILAASGRGDEAERDRLATAAERITLSMPDHSPFAHAFSELALLVYVELLEEAARYNDALLRAGEADDIFGDDEAEEDEGTAAEEKPDPKAGAEPTEDARDLPFSARMMDLALAAGFMLRTKADGWKRFCDRLSVPPFLLWEGFPGLDRLQRSLALAERAAFVEEGFLRWWNCIRPAGEPEATAVPFTVEEVTDATEKMFRGRVEWWGG